MAVNSRVKNIQSDAREKVKELSAKSKIFDAHAELHFPRFNLSEIELGRVLGRGGFCVVNEVRHVEPKRSKSVPPAYETEEDDREFIKSHVIRNGDARYALKQLSDDVRLDAHRYEKGVVDLAIEVKFLAVLDNPHIIKMRGVAEVDPFSDKGYFVMLDRLYDTLERRVFLWRKKKSGFNGVLLKVGGQKKKDELVLDRLLVAYDLACALRYMHLQNIIYRDLKPENIGFDVRDDVKIFDLGLAKELHQQDMQEDGTYNLTGLTGSLRYMAPEVANWQPYNLSADVHSFGILLWQMLSLKQPFQGYNVKMFNEYVVEEGFRPAVKDNWPQSWGMLLRNCWNQDLRQRPNFDEVCECLRSDICQIRGDDEDLALDQTRRSAHSV